MARLLIQYFLTSLRLLIKIPHDILLNQLHAHGICGSLLQWIANFLTNWWQKERIGSFYSKPLPVSYGVIQGSVLGPTLFNFFVNDIDLSVNHCNILKYADDLRIFLSSPKDHRSLLDLQTKIQCDIDNISEWVAASKMTINVKISFYTSFGRSSFQRSYTVNSVSLPYKPCFKDLGLTVSSQPFSFNKHMDLVVGKAFLKLGLIKKLSSRSRDPFGVCLMHLCVLKWNTHVLSGVLILSIIRRRSSGSSVVCVP